MTPHSAIKRLHSAYGPGPLRWDPMEPQDEAESKARSVLVEEKLAALKAVLSTPCKQSSALFDFSLDNHSALAHCSPMKLDESDIEKIEELSDGATVLVTFKNGTTLLMSKAVLKSGNWKRGTTLSLVREIHG